MTKKNPNLTAEQKLIMFEDGTERAGSSELNNEKREWSYHCANCGIKLFESSANYESGSGWPSFYQSMPEVFEIKTDYLLLSENSNEKVSLNTIYRVLKENKALVDNLFDSTFHVLIGFLDDISIGSKIATIVGFHKLIISRNCLIKITISNHTVSYYNPGRHKLNHSKFFICWNK